MTQEERIAPLTLIISTERNFKLASASKGCCHRRNATGRFLGVVGFLFENPQHLFFYQDFSV